MGPNDEAIQTHKQAAADWKTLADTADGERRAFCLEQSKKHEALALLLEKAGK